MSTDDAYVQAARDTVDYQSREFERQQRLLAPGISSRAQYDQAAHALQAARPADRRGAGRPPTSRWSAIRWCSRRRRPSTGRD